MHKAILIVLVVLAAVGILAFLSRNVRIPVGKSPRNVRIPEGKPLADEIVRLGQAIYYDNVPPREQMHRAAQALKHSPTTVHEHLLCYKPIDITFARLAVGVMVRIGYRDLTGCLHVLKSHDLTNDSNW